jgi:dynein heavy chain
MHSVLLVWKHSGHYNAPGRVVVLVREICNDLIAQSRAFVQAEEIFNVEPPEAVAKLQTTLRVCGAFKSQYFAYKSRTATETPKNPWRFQNAALFARLDAFLERCHDILDLTKTVLQFNKLERVEVGGTRGKTLTASVQQIFADFQAAAEKFHALEYDILDVEVKQFRRRLLRVSPDGEGARASARVDHHPGVRGLRHRRDGVQAVRLVRGFARARDHHG